MKLKLYRREAGNSLLVVVFITTLLSVLIGSYLALLSRQNTGVMRSLCWNSALSLAEAGIEEALSQINQNTGNYSLDGWSQSGNNYTKQRTLAQGNYSVTISGAPGSLLTVTSTGSALFSGSSYLSRTVQVTVAGLSLTRAMGLIAKNVNLGGNLGVDSYDSSNPTNSTNGQYDPAKAGDQAIIGTPGLTASVGGSSHVLGYMETAPGGTVTAKGAASIGSSSWVNKGIQPGHALANFTNAIPDVQVPYTSGPAPGPGSVNGTSYDYVLDGGKFMASSLDASGKSTTVVVTAPSTLYVTGNISLQKIVFAPGATLDLYVAAPSLDYFATEGATSPQFTLWGLPTFTDMHLTAGNTFIGVIYAPELNFQANGNASFCGAVVANSFSCNGTFDFHYDVATANVSASANVTIKTWAEL